MDPATRFAIALAERISPDEVDIAPALLASARAGEPAWQSSSSPVVGGVGGLIEIVLGAVAFKAIPLSSMYHVLETSVGMAVLGIHVTDLRAWIKENLASKPTGGRPTEPPLSTADQFFEQVARRLEEKGLPQSDAKRNADIVRELLVAQPEAGAEFLGMLARTP
jgi:hypothetical protein